MADRPLAGRVALVTGATGGIGEECAAALAGLGATVVLGVRNSAKAAETMERIRARHPEADVVEGPPLDMANPASIRAFAAEYEASGRALHLLVNNAGALTFSKSHNQQGVAELCQVNHLGPYLLTRLLERALLRSAPARVVNVSSVTHRYGVIGDPWYDFLKGAQGHHYENTKLANVLFAYELQRRLGPHGVQACAVDPGSVGTSIWRGTPLMDRITNLVWAPPEVGARPLVFAATTPWGAAHAVPYGMSEEPAGGEDGPVQEGGAAPEQDLRYYAPQAFATPLLTSWYQPEGNHGWLGRLLLARGVHASSLWGTVKQYLWVTLAFAVSGVDWPVRQLSGGALLGEVVAVPSAPLSYDTKLAADLWNASADVAGVPREVQLPGGGELGGGKASGTTRRAAQ